jgi:GT2 family glycosyltransferase
MVHAALTTMRRQGWQVQLARLRGHANAAVANDSAAQHDLYGRWMAREEATDAVARRRQQRQLAGWTSRPVISVLMPTFNPPADLLEKAIGSVRAQSYPHWELCIADDASTRPEVRQVLEQASTIDSRIRVVQRTVNGHISAASNSALAIATGDFVALLDHDDELHPMALYWVANEIHEFPDASLIYSDEDKIDETDNRTDPYFKCDLNYELLLSHNMICHLGAYRRSLLVELGGFREGFEGAQDYDIALRMLERLQPTQVRHIPKVLYHWRVHAGSTALSSEAKPYAYVAGERALTEHLERQGLAGTVMPAPEAPNMYRVRFALPEQEPSVEIIVPTRDRADLMRMSIGSVLEKSTYSNYRICIVDNGSTEQESLRLFEQWRKDQRIRVIRDQRPFNFSALNNLAVRSSTSTYVCLLNNDIEVISPDWLSEMVSHASRPGVGCVGARLWYPNDTLQHGGVILGVQGVAGHAHKHLPKGAPGYFGRAVLQQAFSAVTAACLLVSRDTYHQAEGFNEQLEVAFNDVDFCLRVGAAGYRNVWTPHAELYHHESVSRGYEDNPEKQARFLKEIEIMKRRWGDRLLRDPYYSPNLTMMGEDFSIAPL